MKNVVVGTIAVGLLSGISLFYFGYRPSGTTQLLASGCSLLILINMVYCGIYGFRNRRKLRYAAVTPFALSAGVFFMAPSLTSAGVHIRDIAFVSNIEKYDKFINEMKTGDIQIGERITKIYIPRKYSDLAQVVFAKKNETGEITAEFIIGGGFPVKHSGYLYSSSGIIDEETRERWPRRIKVEERWYRISD